MCNKNVSSISSKFWRLSSTWVNLKQDKVCKAILILSLDLNDVIGNFVQSAKMPMHLLKIYRFIWQPLLEANFRGGVKSRIHFPLTPTNFHSVSAWPTLHACWYHAKWNISRKYIHGNGERIHCFTLTPNYTEWNCFKSEFPKLNI